MRKIRRRQQLLNRSFRRRLAFQQLESRELLAKIVSTNFLDSGTIDIESEVLTVQFDQRVVGAEDTFAYRLQRAGLDGLLSDNDAYLYPKFVTVRGNVAILQFNTLIDDIYRLHVSDVILDSSGDRLDGDGDGRPGGDWSDDFVVNNFPVQRVSAATNNTSVSSGFHRRTHGISSDGRLVVFTSNDSNLVQGDINQRTDIFVVDTETQQVTMVNTDSNNSVVARNGMDSDVSISGDGRFVAFESTTKLDQRTRIYVKDLKTGDLRRVAAHANLSLHGTSLSYDGRYLAFWSEATNLVAGSTPGVGNIFVQDLWTNSIQLISANNAGVGWKGSSWDPHLSSDGSKVLFFTHASNVDDPTVFGTSIGGYVSKDLRTGELRVLPSPNGPVYYSSMSDNGNVIAFTEGTESHYPEVKTVQIVAYDFERRLRSTVSATQVGIVGNSSAERPVISADGRRVLFWSESDNLIQDNTPKYVSRLFEKDLVSGDLVTIGGRRLTYEYGQSAISVWPVKNGTHLVIDRLATVRWNQTYPGSELLVFDRSHQSYRQVTVGLPSLPMSSSDLPVIAESMSADGRFVTFSSSASNLVSNPNADGRSNVYLWDAKNAKQTLISDLRHEGNAVFQSNNSHISDDGKYLAYSTFESASFWTTTSGASYVIRKNLSTGAADQLSVSCSSGSIGLEYDEPISSDGRFLLVATNCPLSVEDRDTDRDLYLWDVPNNQVRMMSIPGSESSQVVGRFDGNDAVILWQSLSDQGFFYALNVYENTTTQLADARWANMPFAVWSSDGRYIASCSQTQAMPGWYSIAVFDTLTGDVSQASFEDLGKNASVWLEHLHVTPTERFVYLRAETWDSNERVHTISYFKKNLATGALTALLQSALQDADPVEDRFDSPKSLLFSDDGKTVAFPGLRYGSDHGEATNLSVFRTDSIAEKTLSDSSNFPWTLDITGVGFGQLLPGKKKIVDGYNRLSVNGKSFQSELSAGIGSGPGSLKSNPVLLSTGEKVTREIRSLAIEGGSLLQTLDTIHNPSKQELRTSLSYAGNLASDLQTVVFATSDGDTIVENTDDWIGTDDQDPIGGKPAIIHWLKHSRQDESFVYSARDDLAWGHTVKVAPNETKSIVSMLLIASSQQEALSLMNKLWSQQGVDVHVWDDMSQQEIDSVANFHIGKAAIEVGTSELFENEGYVIAKLVITGVPLIETTVFRLHNSLPSRVVIPTSIEVPAGVQEVKFHIQLFDNDVLDEPGFLTIGLSSSKVIGIGASLVVKDFEQLNLSLSNGILWERGSESRTTGRVSILTPPSQTPTWIELASSNPAQLVVPSFVVIPAGATEVTFPVFARNDGLPDSNIVQVTASSLRFIRRVTEVRVINTPLIVVTSDRSKVRENDGKESLSVLVTRREVDLTKEASGFVSSSNTAEIFGREIFFPAGVDSIVVPLEIVDDPFLDGAKLVQLTATVDGLSTDLPISVLVEDFEPISLVGAPPVFREDAGMVWLDLVFAGQNRTQQFTLNLMSADETRLRFPASQVSIHPNEFNPEGNQYSFAVQVLDNDNLESLQSVGVSATAEGFEPLSFNVRITDFEYVRVAASKPSIKENAGEEPLLLTIVPSFTNLSFPLTLQLTNSDDSELIVPSHVVLPPGATSVTVPVLARDDALLDGDQKVVVSATNLNLVQVEESSVSVLVQDHESVGIKIEDWSLSEKNGSFLARISRSNTNISLPLPIELTSDFANRLVFAPIVIPVGSTSIDVPFQILDDNVLTGGAFHQISIAGAGYERASANIFVQDYEEIRLQADTTIAEDSKILRLKVERLNSNIEEPLEVRLESNLPSGILPPSNIVIPANSAFVVINVEVIDNQAVGDSVYVRLIAISSGYILASHNLTLTDDESSRKGRNPTNPLDVNDDRSVDPRDVLTLVNRLNRDSRSSVVREESNYYDVDGDNHATPLDVLVVINFLNLPKGQAEGESIGVPFDFSIREKRKRLFEWNFSNEDVGWDDNYKGAL